MKNNLDLENFFPYQFSILAQQMSEYIAKIYSQQYGLSRFEWRVLAAIAQTPNITAKTIIAVTRLDKMQVGRAIAKLSDNAYLNQQAHKQDKRSITLALSATGETLYDEIVPKVKAQEKALLARLSQSERDAFIVLTKKLSGLLEQV